jgi:hypothetical protein
MVIVTPANAILDTLGPHVQVMLLIIIL